MQLSFLIKERIHLFNQNIKKYNTINYCGFAPLLYVRFWVDEIFSFFFFGASPDDYFRYEFYRKSLSERNNFITFLKSKKLIKKFNSEDIVRKINSKDELNQLFSCYLHREWLDLDSANNDAFSDFLCRHKKIILKPKTGSGGKGIFVLSQEDVSIQRNGLEEYRGYIAEELLNQHQALSKINPSSVNSIRVMTFRGTILSAVLKVGRLGSVVDNMSSSGLYGNIDLDYGVTNSVFHDIKLNNYYYHPDTNEKLIGLTIPLWNEVKQIVAEASKCVPDLQYCGWDIAVLPDKVAIIEVNASPGHDLSIQSTLQQGIYNKIQQELKKKS